jgi:hypothetical protein
MSLPNTFVPEHIGKVVEVSVTKHISNGTKTSKYFGLLLGYNEEYSSAKGEAIDGLFFVIKGFPDPIAATSFDGTSFYEVNLATKSAQSA